jgi:hypothetical protein
MELTYYIWENNAEAGPYTLSQMRSIWSSGRITLKSMIRESTETDWKEAVDFEIIYSTSKSNQNQAPIQQVIVTNFEMTFRSMVVFMCKWAIAAIPAALILIVLFILLTSALGFLGIMLGSISGR